MTRTAKLLAELIALPSVNPAFLPPRHPHAGEGRVAEFLKTRLQNYKPTIDLIPARKQGTEFSPDNPEILKPLLKAIFTSDWFFKNEYRGVMIKSPVDFTVGMARQMEMSWPPGFRTLSDFSKISAPKLFNTTS